MRKRGPHAGPMGNDSNTEMDILLRRHARRGSSGMAGAKDVSAKAAAVAGSGPTHMDADELSAYAEGALPDAVRLRYSAHLADCDSCRRIITELVISSAATPAAQESNVVQTISAPARSWREWFAAIFSTPLLRYGVPALAMFALVAIVLVVATRNREEPSLVARGPDAQQPANTTTEDQKQGTANSTTGETSDAAATQGTPVSANANTGVANSNAPLDRAQQKDAATGNSGYQIDGVAPAAAPKTTDTTAAEPQPQNIQERRAEDKQSAPQPSQNSAATDTFENRAEKKKKEQDDVALAAQKQRESVTAAPGAAAGTVSSRRARGGETAASGSGVATDSARNETQKSQAGKRAPATVGRAMRDGADEDSAGETRSVAGKRFRRQKGVWVDTAYNSSRSPLRVRRGTEQYRALVADEPVIGTVSTSLAGDVIVVVKGRAYHIY